MKQRIGTVLLALCIVFTLLSVTALAAETTEPTNPHGTGSAGQHDSWTALDGNGGPLESGSYYLDDDLELTNSLTVADGATVTICLNGKKLDGSWITSGNGIINMGTAMQANYLHICDCTVDEKSTSPTWYGQWEGESYALTSASSLAGTTDYSPYDAFYGGVITGGKSGGIYALNSYSEVYLWAGAIAGNTNTGNGGGINFDKINIFQMSGSSKIAGNKSSDNGGGVCMRSGTFQMKGGSISGNTASSEGGGVYLYAYNGNVALQMSGGSISGNTATNGGGVYMDTLGSAAAFTMSAGEITNNTASGGEGGGVYMYSSDSAFTLSGSGSISGNTAGSEGGGVYLNRGSFTMSGGSITGNLAPVGGGVYNSGNNVTFTLDGTVDISGNKIAENGENSNVALNKYIGVPTINLTSGFGLAENAAPIGVSIRSGNGVFTPGVFTSGAANVSGLTDTDTDGNPTQTEFRGEGQTLLVYTDPSTGAAELYLGTMHTITLKSDDTATAKTYTLKVPDGESFDLDDYKSIGEAGSPLADWAAPFGKALSGWTYGNNEYLYTSNGIDAITPTESMTLVAAWGPLRAAHYICGGSANSDHDHDGDSTPDGCGDITYDYLAYTAGDKITADTSGAAYYYLTGPINGGIRVDTNGLYNLYLCLHGQTLTGGVYVETGNNDINLHLCDCTGGGTITGGAASDSGGGVYADGSVTMYGGTISNNTAVSHGGGIYAGADFTMYGGTISNNTAGNSGGGVSAGNDVILYGGTITGNTASGDGGGVYTLSGSVTISGKILEDNSSVTEIKNNTADKLGGGIYTGGSVTMSGGLIQSNKAGTHGGGVYAGKNFDMTGGWIQANTACIEGGGVLVREKFTMTKTDPASKFPMISSNEAEFGGGVYADGSFTATGVGIGANTASGSGAGVYFTGDALDTVTFSGSVKFDSPFQWSSAAVSDKIRADVSGLSSDAKIIVAFDGSVQSMVFTKLAPNWLASDGQQVFTLYNPTNGGIYVTTVEGQKELAYGGYIDVAFYDGVSANLIGKLTTLSGKAITIPTESLEGLTIPEGKYLDSWVDKTDGAGGAVYEKGSTAAFHKWSYLHAVLKEYITAAADRNEYDYGDTVTLTVQLNPEVTGMSEKLTLYQGDTQLAAGVTEKGGGEYTITYATVNKELEVGENTLTVKFAGSGDAAAREKDVTFTLNKKELTVDAAATGRAYEPGNTTVAVSAALNGIVGSDNVTLNTVTSGTIPDDDADTYTVPLSDFTLSGADAAWYTVQQPTVQVEISPAGALAFTGTVYVTNGQAADYTVDLSVYKPVNGTWGDSFPTTYPQPVANFTVNGYYEVYDNSLAARVEGTSLLILPIKAVDSTEEGSIGTITVRIISQNFETSTLTLTVKRINHTHSWSYSASGDTITATCGGEGVCPLTDSKATIQLVPTTVTYDGNPKTVTVKQTPENTFSDLPEVAYPEGNTDAGTWKATLTYQGVKATADFTIDKANASVTTDPTAIGSLVYTGQSQELIKAGSATGGEMKYSLDGTNYSAVIPTGTAAGEYTVHYKVVGDSNHNDTTAQSVTVPIDKADAAVSTAPKVKNDLVYDGKAQKLVSAGEASGGTMQYTLGENDKNAPAEGWGTNIPEGTNAGTYYVWYKVVGDSNHNDTAAQGVLVTIHKADPATPDAPTTSSVGVYSVTLETVDGCEYSKDGTNWQDSPVFTGLESNTEYTFYQRRKETDNYNVSGESEGLTVTTGKTYNVWVGGVQVTDDNRTDVLGAADGDGSTVTFAYISGDSGNEPTLTLNGAAITGGYEYKSGRVAGIYAAGSLNIELTGADSRVTAPDGVRQSFGIWVGDELSIFGDSGLTLTTTGGEFTGVDGSGAPFGESCGIRVGELLYIGGVHVAATGDDVDADTAGNARSIGLYTEGGLYLYSGGSLTARGGTAKGVMAYSIGIEAYGEEDAYLELAVHDGTLTAEGGDAVGIKDAGSEGIYVSYGRLHVYEGGDRVTLRSGKAEATSTNEADEPFAYSNGIYVYVGDVEIEAGTVEITGGDWTGPDGDGWGIYVNAVVGSDADGNVRIIPGCEVRIKCDEVTPAPNHGFIGTKVTITAADGYAIYADGGITVDETLTISSPVGGKVADYGDSGGKTVKNAEDERATSVTIEPLIYTVTIKGLSYDMGVDVPAGKSVNEIYCTSLGVDDFSETLDTEKDGYIFKGWCTEDGDKFDFDTEIEEDMTICAQWQEVYYEPYVPTTSTTTTKNEDGSTTTTKTNNITGTVTETTKNTDGSTTVVETKKDGTVTTTNTGTTTETAQDGTTTTTDSTVTETVAKDGTSTMTATTQTKTETVDGSTETVKVEQTVVKGENTISATTTTTTETAEKTETVEVKSETVMAADGTETTTTTTQTKTETADGSTATTTQSADGTVTAEVTISEEAAAAASEAGVAVTLPIPAVEVSASTETAPTVTVTTGNSEAVTVEVPVSDVTPGTVVVIVNADGTETVVTKTGLTETGVTVTLEGDATVKVVDNAKTFTDVGANDWHSDAVDFVSARGLYNGVGNDLFDPEGDMSRGMLATVLHNLEDNPAHTHDDPFHDVHDHHWYEESVHWAAQMGYVEGYPDGSFRGENAIIRQDVVVLLWRYAGSPESDHDISHFADAGAVSAYAEAAVCWANEHGILNGMNGLLNPHETATRAHVAQLLMNYLERN